MVAQARRLTGPVSEDGRDSYLTGFQGRTRATARGACKMIRLPKWVIHTAFLAALLLSAGIGVTVVKARWATAVRHPINSEILDPDYVQGLAKLGIARLPGYKPSPTK
jgi:hypothetical protein